MHQSERRSVSCAVGLGLILASCGGQSMANLGVVEDCSNHADDDGDGKVDCADPQCFSAPLCLAGGTEDCANGVDDDDNGEVDCADPRCEGASCGEGCVCSDGLPRQAGPGDGGAGGSGGGSGTDGGTAGGSGGGSATGGGTAGGSGGGSATGGGTAGGSGGGSATGGGTAGGSGGGSATGGGTSGVGGGGGAGGGTASPCTTVMAHPAQATDQQLWDCAQVPGQLGACSVSTCAGTCACTSYVRSTTLCGTSGACAAPLSGTGCSDSTYYSAPPLQCSGSAVAQSACMLRKLIALGYCQ